MEIISSLEVPPLDEFSTLKLSKSDAFDTERIIVSDHPDCDTERIIVSDHPDCDDDVWGPEVLSRKGYDDILSLAEARNLPREYVMEDVLSGITAESDEGDSFYVVDLTTVVGKLKAWKDMLPRVQPHYAVKCNGDDVISKLLARAGCGFDCASKAEIEYALSLGVPVDKIIYANPCKQASMLRYARAHNVRLMTADNVEEIRKIASVFPEAKVVIRIAVDDSKSLCRFNSKFGAPEHEWHSLLRTCVKLGVTVVGFSFHVGSGCGDMNAYAEAVASARDAFEAAKGYGFAPYLLDCGGGFPGSDSGAFTFRDVAKTISEAIELHFPASEGVEVIAEPGRYMVCASHTYAVSVIAKRQLSESQLVDTADIEAFGARPNKDDEDEDNKDAECGSSDEDNKDQVELNISAVDEHGKAPQVALYISDGTYGSFNCVVFDHAELHPHVLGGKKGNQMTVPTKLFGPTCDSIDVVMGCTRLPELRVGDWLYFSDMGAYTRCAASRFNGQGEHTVHYVWTGMP